MKRILSLALALLTVLSLAACGGQGSSDGSGSGDGSSYTTYSELYDTELSTLNYLYNTNTTLVHFSYMVEDGLVEFDRYGLLRPCIAENWEISDDELVYTFHLRDDVMWYDNQGNEVTGLTAHDFVAAAQYVLDPGSGSTLSSTIYNVIEGAEAYFNQETTDFSTVGIRALDDYTLEYTLSAPCAYFLRMLSMNAWFPAQADFLAEHYDTYGTNSDELLYCGAYYCSEWEPEYQRVLQMNKDYWNADIISIERLTYRYNAEATSNGAELFLRGDTDKVALDTDLIAEWMNDESLWSQVHRASYTNMSYWMAFNFDPQYEEEYAPDDWRTAVNNVNFRKAMFYGYDRYAAVAAIDPYTYEDKVLNTFSRPGLVTVGTQDFLEMGGLDEYSSQDNLYNAELAQQYKETAMSELEGQVTFPIQVVMAYNVNGDAAARYQVVEQQMERDLGTDFIDIILVGYSGSSFNSEVRNTGLWSFMELGWGPDFADPYGCYNPLLSTLSGRNWGKLYMATEYYDESLGYGTLEKMALAANAITDDLAARYEAFAEAEKFMLDEALLIPAYMSGGGYEASLIEPFTGLTAQMGDYSLRKMKGAVIMDHSVGEEEYQELYDAYITARDEARLAYEEESQSYQINS